MTCWPIDRITINMKSTLITTLALAVSLTALRAQDAIPLAEAEGNAVATKLAVGSEAPEFKPAKWLQGEAVTGFEKDKTYLIECWATWCGPCIAAIPHVNELHKKFKDQGLVVIGANVWEDDAAKAEAFVKSKGDGMAYRVAFDGGKSGDIAKNWLGAAGVHGIPHAFVIRENKLFWHGHPSQLTEETVATMLAGKFNAEKSAADAADKESARREMSATDREFRALVREKKPDQAAKKLARLVELAPKLGLPPGSVVMLEQDGQVDLALAKGDAELAVALIKKCAPTEQTQDSARQSFGIASKMITTPELGTFRDYKFALDCLEKAMTANPDLANEAMAQMLKARAHDGLGNKDESLKILESVGRMEMPLSVAEEIKAVQDALNAGKPWPKGSMNPDAR